MSKATLPLLDSSLYPQVWAQQTFTDPHHLLMALLTDDLILEPKDFARQLLANDVYQEWIQTTVFGRYIQHNFAAFYHQSEDSFNVDIPALFRHELMRYAQYLPLEQIFFVAGQLSNNVRQEKLLSTTANPVTAVMAAQKAYQNANRLSRSNEIIVNQIQVVGKQVLGFALRHNKRTSDCIRNEILILDFHGLRLVNEQRIEGSNTAILNDTAVLLRSYELY